MIERHYHREASRTRFAAAAISVAALGIGGLAFTAGSRTLRHVMAILAQACLRMWAALPHVLQVALGVSAVIILVSLALWLFSLARQWWNTSALLRSLDLKAAEPPARIRALLAKHGLTERVTIVQDARLIALTGGLLAPRIIVSTGLISTLEGDELEAVLLHEQSHLLNRDPLHLLITRSLRTAFFYLPVLRTLVERHEAAIELAADEYVIHRQGGPLGLSSALVKLLDMASPSGVTGPFTSSANLRLARLLEQEVSLPQVTRWSMLQTATSMAAVSSPAFAVLAFGRALEYLPLAARCVL